MHRLIYIASGVALDHEMEKRIVRHQADRRAQNIQWLTIEAPYDIANTLHKLADGDVVLWDCVTTWLTNAFTRVLTRELRVWNNLAV